MEPPPGYPPPTLVRRRTRFGSARFIILFLVLFGGLGYYLVSELLDRAPPSQRPERATADVSGVADADAPAAAMPDAAEDGIIVEQPVEPGTAEAKAGDARKPNQWYFVMALGDGPGAIYSRDGGEWDFALACTKQTRMIEIIAVGTGFPGSFVDQSIRVGKVRLMMDATYAKLAGGTISTTLPAAHPFFDALVGDVPMEFHLVADRKTIVPVGPAVVRLIQDCRSRS